MSPAAISLLSLGASIIPTLGYVLLIYWVDRYEKEPVWLLAAAFLWGAVPAFLLASLFNSLLGWPVYVLAGESVGALAAATLIAPPIEESLKGAILLGIFFLWRHEIDSPLDGIIYGAMVGMGFGMVENVYYFVDTFENGGLGAWGINVTLRGIFFGLNHALYSSMMGLGLAIARLSRRRSRRWAAPLFGWTLAVILHAIHNLSASLGGLFFLVLFANAWGGVLITAVIVIWAITQEGYWIRDYLRDEVDEGVLTSGQYALARSAGGRMRARWAAYQARGWRGFRAANHFYYRCSELAYKKHHQALFADAHSAQLIVQLRQEVRRLSASLPAPTAHGHSPAAGEGERV